MKPVKQPIDVVVIGGGTAGIAAAIASARQKKSVVLVEKYGFLGGMATTAYVGTICGLYFRSSNKISRLATCGFPAEFTKELQKKSKREPLCYKGLHFFPYNVFDFQYVCDSFISKYQIPCYFHSSLTQVSQRDDLLFELTFLGGSTLISIQTKTIVDCTGEAIVGYLLKDQTQIPEYTQATAIVFEITNLPEFPLDSLQLLVFREIQRGIANQELPKECERVSIVPGSYHKQKIAFKLGMTPLKTEPQKYSFLLSEQEIKGRKLIHCLSEYLIKAVPFFKETQLSYIAPQIGIRTGRRALGKQLLTEQNVLECHQFSNAIANGVWPIENWGKERKPEMKFFKEDSFYQIPAGCLQSQKYSSLFYAGRAISATDSAIASARVIGTCFATGFAAGTMASFYSERNSIEKAIEFIQKAQLTFEE